MEINTIGSSRIDTNVLLDSIKREIEAKKKTIKAVNEELENLLLMQEQIQKAYNSSFDSKGNWLNENDVIEMFGIPKSNIKDKKWRDKHGFPYSQPNGSYAKVYYSRKDIEKWLDEHSKLKEKWKC